MRNFNTSYVAVQLLTKFFSPKFLSISIHLMLRFNAIFHFKPKRNNAFQYILCCGSTLRSLEYLCVYFLFQYILCCGSTLILLECKILIGNFNTSYVAVQRFETKNLNLCLVHFNTSYVAVQPF